MFTRASNYFIIIIIDQLVSTIYVIFKGLSFYFASYIRLYNLIKI
jgi:hypothetical protein